MPLSRLENFLRSPKGNIIYVDPNSFDSTDNFENRGDSASRTFSSLQRALVEAARFSYQKGFSNDLNDRTTILVYPGTHYIDNRPGFYVSGSSFKKRTGADEWTTEVLNEFSELSNFNIFDPNNDLYKFNSVEGGVILPRGTSIVGLDLRKTKIKPLYVPDPYNSDVERSSIFKVTGNCYFTSFTFFDADPSVAVYKDYTDDLYVPKFSHHKLTAFTYADGVNKVEIDNQLSDLTDLQMYYYKVAKAYGNTSGRDIPDYPANTDIEPVIDEYRIVGVLEENLLGISSIRSGDGTGGGVLSEITVTTRDLISNVEAPHNLSPNTPILISGISVNPESYNGSFVVNSVVGPNTFTYITPSTPSNKLPSSLQTSKGLIKVESDSTSSSSPYIFNCSLRSVYGMCGLWADGSRADGFKSVVVAQFTGISLQKDDNAFILYSQANSNYIQSSQLSLDSNERPLHTNSYSIYKPEYENFHIKVTNNSFIQCVSIFAIGYAKHFVTETGGDMSITNSNSNFGTLALESLGFRDTSFNRDDVGYITHIIPPKENPKKEMEMSWLSLDVGLIVDSSNNLGKKLYLYNYNDENDIPPIKINGFRIGAKTDDRLYVSLDNTSTIYSSPILMDVYSGTGVSARKSYKITRTGNLNSITNNIITFTSTHQLSTGEKVRIFSDTGQVPDGLETNKIYYAIRVNSTQIKLAFTYSDAIATNPQIITDISNNGGIITVVSSVTDKIPGDVGHPIQWDSTVNNWYLISSTTTTNGIYTKIKQLGVSELGDYTETTYFTRINDNRSIEDRLYKVRYVIPKDYTDVRVPGIGFVLQETKTVGVTTTSLNTNSTLKVYDKRNEKIINSITAGSLSNNTQIVTAKTEAPHKLIVGDTVKVKNVKSTYNPNAIGLTSSFNGTYEVLSIPDSHTFTYRISGISTNPGSFSNDLKNRNSSNILSLPVVSRNKYKNTFVVYRVDTIKNHIPGGQDGIYYITLISSNVSTNSNIGYGLSTREYNQDVKDLYPQIDRDNYESDPKSAVSYADHKVIGKVITNDKRNSLTKETTEYFLQNNQIGFGITGLTLTGTGYTTITVQTDVEHKLNSILSINITNGGSGQTGTYYGAQVTIGSTITDAICNYTTDGGEIDVVEFIDYGSAFGIGQTIGIGTLGGVAEITSINSHIGDGLELGGFFQEELNDVFKIINIPDSKTIVLESSNSLSAYVPNTNSRTPFGFISSKGIGITSFAFSDINTGIVTVTTSVAHGLLEGNNFKVIGSGSTIYDSNFIVDTVVGFNTFTFNIGEVSSTPSSTQGTLYHRTLTTNAKTSGKTGENIGNRCNFIYGGVTTEITSITDTQIQLTSSDGFNRGDYIQANGEIIRLTTAPSGNTFNIERKMFGTFKQSISAGTRVYKIKIIPIELRRPSFMRASGHTFEYLGYGPGNYSTSVPQKQNRKLSDDEILVSQSRKISGGTVVYSGMNDLGEFYYGAKRVSSVTGQETIIEAPVLSYTGDDADGTDDPSKLSGLFDNVLVRQKITVEGGESGNETSIFYGPVSFQNSVDLGEGLSVKSLTLNNKLFKTNDKTSTVKGSISYVGYSSSYIGEILTENGWRRWGLISKSEDSWDLDLDNVTIENLTITGSLDFTGSIIFDSFIADQIKAKNTILLGGASDPINANSFLSYGLKIEHLLGDDVSTTISHRGISSFNIATEDSGSSLSLSNSGISTLSLDSNGVITVSRNINSYGSAGAHLAILNRNTNGDAVLSWRSASKNFWFAGVDSTNNYWKLAYSDGSPINLQSFTNSSKLVVRPNGWVGIGTTNPTTTLQVQGNIRPEKIEDRNKQSGTLEQVLTATAEGLLDWRTFGRIVQVVSNTYNSNYVEHSTTWGDTGLSVNIQASTNNSKFLIIVTQPITTINDGSGALKIQRVVTGDTTDVYGTGNVSYGSSSAPSITTTSTVASIVHIDEPSSSIVGIDTSITYKTVGRTNKGIFYSNCGLGITEQTSRIFVVEFTTDK